MTPPSSSQHPYGNLSPKDVDLSGHVCVCSWKSCRKWQIIFAAHQKFHNPTEVRAGNCLNLRFTKGDKSAQFSQIVQKHLRVKDAFPAGKQIYVARHHWRCRQLQRFDEKMRPSTTVSRSDLLRLSGVDIEDEQADSELVALGLVDDEAHWVPPGDNHKKHGDKKEYFMAPNVPMEAVGYAVDCILASVEGQQQQQLLKKDLSLFSNVTSSSTSSSSSSSCCISTSHHLNHHRESTIKPAPKDTPRPTISSAIAITEEENATLSEENKQLRQEIERLEERLSRLHLTPPPPCSSPPQQPPSNNITTTEEESDDEDLAHFVQEALWNDDDNDNNKEHTYSHIGAVGSTVLDGPVLIPPTNNDGCHRAVVSPTQPKAAAALVPHLKRQKTSSSPLPVLPQPGTGTGVFSSWSSLSGDETTSMTSEEQQQLHQQQQQLQPPLWDLKPEEITTTMEALISNLGLDNDPDGVDNDFFAGAA